MNLEKYSMGIGDRFAHQAKAQLLAMVRARSEGVEVVPVWNKSHREHVSIGSSPSEVRKASDEAIQSLGWRDSFYVDADHVGLETVDLFMESSDFFTIDVADFIGQTAGKSEIQDFVNKYDRYIGELSIPGIPKTLEVNRAQVERIAGAFLLAVKEAGNVYRHIASKKGADQFVAEVSMDETEVPQSPVELFFILAAIADEGIPIQTIAPKFTGRFNKGVDYVGDVQQFTKEFEEDLAVIAFAVGEFNLPENLKLSVHSGSDKFSIYGPINRAIRKFDAGLHLKTAGTTWLEELIGLATAGGEGLVIAKEVYGSALKRFDELAAPYSAVIDIDRNQLPSQKEIETWEGQAYVDALRHEPGCEAYNPHFRQLLHIGYKVIADMGDRFLDALREFEEVIAEQVTTNIYERHLKRIFIEETE